MQAWQVLAVLVGGGALAYALSSSSDAVTPPPDVGGTYGKRIFEVVRNGPTWRWNVDDGSTGGEDSMGHALLAVLGWLGERAEFDDVVRLVVGIFSLVVQPAEGGWMWSLYGSNAQLVKGGYATTRGAALIDGVAELEDRTEELPW